MYESLAHLSFPAAAKLQLTHDAVSQALAAANLSLARRIAQSSDADLAEFVLSQHGRGEEANLRRDISGALGGAWHAPSSPLAALPGSSFPELQASQRALEAALTLCTK